MKLLRNSVFTATLLVIFYGTPGAQVIINEFMALNASIHPDMCDYDDFSDWIELYNTTDKEIDLKGYYLTDNYNNPKKWPFPEGATIAANGFLIIRADGADSKPGMVDTIDSYPWNIPFTTRRYHTNFRLAEEGEEIGLFRNLGPTLICIDSVSYSRQFIDVSLGRNPSKGNTWYRYDQPTPAAANTTDGKSVEASGGTVFSSPVTFSIPGGFYDAAQTLTMSVTSGEIYYTTDGSVPFTTSIKYTGPITIDSTTVFRARCFEPAKLAGKVTTATYFIGEKRRSLMMVSITTDTSYLYDSIIGVFRNSYKNREVPISIEFFTPGGALAVKVNAGMTLGSLTNFTCPQKPLQVQLRGSRYGDDFIWHRLFDKQIICFERLRLRQGGDAWGTNLIADGILEAMCKGQLELGIQAYRPVVLFINGGYYGIHDLREQFNDLYFTNNYNVDPATKDEVRSTLLPIPGKVTEGWELVDGSWDGYNELLSLARSGDMTDELYGKMKDHININSFVDFFCAIVFVKQISWGHNQDLWRVNTMKWQWLCADFDRAFVYQDKFARIDFNNFTCGAGASGSIMAQDSLFPKFIKNASFRDYFTQRFAAHLNSTFKPSRMIRIVDSLASLLSPEMDEYVARWGKARNAIPSVTAWRRQIDSVKLFCMERGSHVFNFFNAEPFNYKGTASLTVKLSDETGGVIFINGVRMCAGLDNLTFVKNCPIEIKAVASPGFVFAGWNGGASVSPLTITIVGDSTITAKFEASQLHAVPAVISENTTLSLTDNSYCSSGDILVDTGATLTIEKGVTLLMAQDADILVKGRLIINGTAEAPVTIKANTGAGAKNWGALNFENAKKTNTLTWVTVTETTLGDDPINQRGGINGNCSDVVIDHMTMSNIIYPLCFEYGSTTISNSTIIVDHICNGAVHIGRGCALIKKCLIYSTGLTVNTDAIDIKGVENCVICENRIYNFNGFNSDAIDIGEGTINVLVKNNIIYGSHDKGISVGGKSTVKAVNNIIVDCDIGIGVKDEFSYAEIDHNTFVRNRIAIATYEKAFGRGGGAAKATNCIFAASKARSIYSDHSSSIEISHCLSDVDVFPGTANIFTDPLFVDMARNNFQLLPGSPCINAGDPAFFRDADGTVTDIGAQYTFDSVDFPDSLAPHLAPPRVVLNEIMYNDNKNHPIPDWIELYNPAGEEVDLSNWKLTDKGDYKNWMTSIAVADLDSNDLFFFPGGTKINKKNYLVLCADTALFRKAYSNSTAEVIGNLPFGLNGTETILLYDSADKLVNVVCFNKSYPWPVAPDGKGPSLELIDATGLNYHPLNWKASKNNGGTPGKANTASPMIHKPVVASQLACVLAQNHPNPCKSATTILFTIPREEHVNISIYTISGRLLETLLNDKIRAGVHRIKWNAGKYSAGIYFYRIKAGGFTATRKITIQ